MIINGESDHKLLDLLARKFADVIGTIAERRDEPAWKEYWRISNAVMGALKRLDAKGFVEAPAIKPPSEEAVDEFLSRVVAESRERGGELTL